MVVLSSCTNYDDQFDDLNTQINTLKSQIEGFSSLSSGLTALQGTVASLQSAINNIPVTPATDISGLEASLTSLAAEVTALQTSLASAATAAEVAALTTSLAAVQADLADLLAANNVYSEDILVTNASTLTFAKNLGDKLAIVNGNVTFVVTPEMNIAEVQEVANKLVTVTKDLSYFATSSTVAGVTFDNLTSAGDIEYSQSSDLKMANLESAGTISLAASTKVGIVDFRSLSSVTAINMATFTNHTSGASSSSAADRIAVASAAGDKNKLDFSSATEIHLTALPYYTAGLTIIGKTDGVVALTAFASVDADGEEAATNLSITGPASVSMGDNYTLGTFTATDVNSVTLSAHRGQVNLEGVVNFTHNKLVTGLKVTGTTDLETVDITGSVNDDPTLTKADTTGPSLATALKGQTSLKTVDVDGIITGGLDLSGASNLTTLSVDGKVDTVTLLNNNDLTSVTTAGSITNFSIESAQDLTSLTLGHATLTSATVTAGSLIVKNNPKLASLTSVADKLKTLTLTGNTVLSTIDFTGLKTKGATADKATVTIGGSSALANALNASKITDTYNASVTTQASNTGSFTSTSGMSTLKTYLIAAAGAASATGVKVFFDSADILITEGATAAANTEASGLEIATAGDVAALTVVNVVPNSADTGETAVKGKSAFMIDARAANTLQITVDGLSLYVDATGAAKDLVLSGNNTLDLAAIKSSSAITRATAEGVTFNAYAGGSASSKIVFYSNVSSATGEGLTGAATNTVLGTDDYLTLNIDGDSVTTTITPATANAPTAAELASGLAAAWDAKFGTGKASAAYSLFDVAATSDQIDITLKSEYAGSRGHGKSISVGVTAGTVTATAPKIGYSIGETRATTDNKTVGEDIILSFENNSAGTFTAMPALVVTGTVSEVTLASTAYQNKTTALNKAATSTQMYVDEARADVVNAEDAVAAATSNASTTNKTHWL